jgi:hypothetical protein
METKKRTHYPTVAYNRGAREQRAAIYNLIDARVALANKGNDFPAAGTLTELRKAIAKGVKTAARRPGGRVR